MSKFLTREQILSVQDLNTITHHVDEWDADVRIRTLSSKERDAFEKSLFTGGNYKNVSMENFRAKLVSLVLVDEKGDNQFTEKDLDALGKKSAAAIDGIFSAAQKLSGITKKDVEELTKN